MKNITRNNLIYSNRHIGISLSNIKYDRMTVFPIYFLNFIYILKKIFQTLFSEIKFISINYIVFLKF